jgi:tRNA U55 pseudouridine synthase TruB
MIWTVLQELRRTKIGNFSAADALTPQQWKDYWKQERTPPANNNTTTDNS